MNSQPRKRRPSAAPAPLEKPNVDDPLSEPTRHRRLWAAYLAAGFTRRDFAAKLGTNYHTVNRWDAGAATISLDMLERASLLVGFSMDELCFGRRGVGSPAEPVTAVAPQRPKLAGPRQPEAAALTEAEIRALFDTQRVDAATRAAFGQHAASPAGRYQTFTSAYVEAWCSAYAYARDDQQALMAAVNARAVTEAAAAGVAAVSSEQLRTTLRGRGSKA